MIDTNKAQKSRPKLLRMDRLIKDIGLSKSYIYQLVKEGKFPKPVKIVPGGSTSAWIEDEVYEWLDKRIAERDE